jgi:hypothetical protein
MPSGPSQDAGGGNGLSVLGVVGRGKCNAASGEALPLDSVDSAALTETGWSQQVVPAQDRRRHVPPGCAVITRLDRRLPSGYR